MITFDIIEAVIYVDMIFATTQRYHDGKCWKQWYCEEKVGEREAER